ncbi:MAG: HDOD domain-containing protein [Planctomycetota bacterium]
MIDAPRPGRVTPDWVSQQLSERLDRVLSPAVGPAVLRELGRPDANFNTVAELLEADPYLTGRFIAVAELARPDHEEPLRQVEDAVRLLGLKQAEALLLSVMLIGPLANDIIAVQSREDVWAWAIGCGIAGDVLAKHLDPANAQTPAPSYAGFVDGLMLGLGTLVMLAGVGWPYSQTLGPQVRPVVLADDERAEYGVSHHLVTTWALDAMGCPRELAGSSLALADPDQWQSPAARFGHAVELYGARLAGFQQAAIDEFLQIHLPAFGGDYTRLQRDTLMDGQNRLKDMMDAFGGVAPLPDRGVMMKQAGNALAQQVEDASRRRSA